MKRPASITVAAWVILVMAGDGIVGSFSSVVQPILNQLADPHVGLPLTALLGSLMQITIIICAVCMLRGASWARIVYAVLAAVGTLGLIVSWYRVAGMGLIAVYTIAKTIVLLYVLFRPEANAYFAGSPESVSAGNLAPIGRPEA